MDPWSIVLAGLGIAAGLFGTWRTVRARPEPPDIRADWLKPNAAKPDRMLRIWQEDSDARWEIHRVRIKGNRDKWLSDKWDRQEGRFTNVLWTDDVRKELPKALTDIMLLALHPDAPKLFALQLTLKPSGGCLIPYHKTYPCRERFAWRPD